MDKADLNETMSATKLVLAALLDTLSGSTGKAGAQLNYLCGKLRVNGPKQLNVGGYDFWADLVACFEAAPLAGATFLGMDTVRLVARALTPSSLPAVALKNFATRMALAEQARILSATTFTSRQQLDAVFDQIDVAFNDAELVAADNMDNVAYRALIAIHAAVSNDLATRSFTLPRMTTYKMPIRMPALTLAQRIYYDPSRSGELIAENRPIHPLFMPSSGVALST